MKPKTIITTVLLLFVAVSMVTLTVKKSSDAPEAGTGGETATSE